MNLFCTGMSGFIGTNFIRYMLSSREDTKILNLDALTYAANRDSLKDIKEKYPDRYMFVLGDINNKCLVSDILENGKFDCIVHSAAESHVDRSIKDSSPFIQTNIVGTQVLLDCIKGSPNKNAKIIHFSTDEVMGDLGSFKKRRLVFTDKSPIKPNSPYAASKAAGELLARSYHKTFGLDIRIVRPSNNYGPYQHPEKLIPLTILRASQNLPIPVYGQGLQMRHWLHVYDTARAIEAVINNGTAGEIYLLGPKGIDTPEECAFSNIQIIETILVIMNKPKDLIRFVDDRLGHDFRYEVSEPNKKLRWQPFIKIIEGLNGTVNWYMQNPEWINTILKTNDFKTWMKEKYNF